MMAKTEKTYGAIAEDAMVEGAAPLFVKSAEVEVAASPSVSRAAGEWYGTVGLGGVLVMALAYAGLGGHAASGPTSPATALVEGPAKEGARGGPPSLSVSNAYERDVLGHAVGDGMFWDHIVERFRPTTLEVRLSQTGTDIVG
jgi:hypothetical protein